MDSIGKSLWASKISHQFWSNCNYFFKLHMPQSWHASLIRIQDNQHCIKNHHTLHTKQQKIKSSSPTWPSNPLPSSLSQWGYDTTASVSTSVDTLASDDTFVAPLAHCLASSGVILGKVMACCLLQMQGECLNHLLQRLENTVVLSEWPSLCCFVFVLPELKMLRVAGCCGR